MGRAKTQAKRKSGAKALPTPKGVGRPPDLSQFSGTQRPDSPTANPKNIADPKARVIQTRS